MKYTSLDFHFVSEKVREGMIWVTHISKDGQLADTLTKHLPKPRFQSLIQDWSSPQVVHFVGAY